MSETTTGAMLTLEAGSKIKRDGTAYQVTETITVPADVLEEGKKQVNPRIAFVCSNETCKTFQRSNSKRGTLVKMYMTETEVKNFWAPQCGGCGAVCVPATEADKVKQGKRIDGQE